MVPYAYQIKEMVDAYDHSPVAYALDIGVNKDDDIDINISHLVEANDAFALGTYGLNSALYCEMISERWKELVK